MRLWRYTVVLSPRLAEALDLGAPVKMWRLAG